MAGSAAGGQAGPECRARQAMQPSLPAAPVSSSCLACDACCRSWGTAGACWHLRNPMRSALQAPGLCIAGVPVPACQYKACFQPAQEAGCGGPTWAGLPGCGLGSAHLPCGPGLSSNTRRSALQAHCRGNLHASRALKPNHTGVPCQTFIAAVVSAPDMCASRHVVACAQGCLMDGGLTVEKPREKPGKAMGAT